MFLLPLALLTQEPRFAPAAPLPSVNPVMIDRFLHRSYPAQELSIGMGAQARIMWIDGTANLDKTNSSEKIVALVSQIKSAGFNTIVFDVKPISGQTLYPSAYAAKITEWKGQTLPKDFDPLKVMSAEAKRLGIDLFVSLNAFSEGHNLFKVGPGYNWPDRQSVIYEGKPAVGFGDVQPMELASKPNLVDPAKLALFNDAKAFANVQPDSFIVTVDSDSKVVDGFAVQRASGKIPTIPQKGFAIVAAPAMAEQLKALVLPGITARLQTIPQFMPTGERQKLQYPLMMNPLSLEVQDRNLCIIHEVAANYPIKGVIYDDRLRFAGFYSDFSPETREAFEHKVGTKLSWPNDVFIWTLNPDFSKGVAPGPYYDQWVAFRAGAIQRYLTRVRRTLKAANPQALLGSYVGSWYGEYPALGINYAAPDYDAGFWFLTPKYQASGAAEMWDFVVSGCYYSIPTVYTAMVAAKPIGQTIEAAALQTGRAVNGQCWTIAGIALDQFKGDPNGLKAALQAACASSQGVMVFDLSHDVEPMWPVFTDAFSNPAKSPLAFTKELRKYAATKAKAGKRTNIVLSGGSGVGQ